MIGSMSELPPSRRRLNFPTLAGGIGAGGLLFVILSLATGNPWLGLAFGLLPGTGIGLWLALTSRS